MTIVDCSGHDVYVLCLYVMVQGDFKTKIIDLLIKEGYTKTKGIGG